MQPRPTLTLALGDAAGIGAELAAKVLADDEVRAAARLVVVGDQRLLARGIAQAGVDAGLAPDDIVDMRNIDPEGVTPGEASESTGAAALDNFATALAISDRGGADAVCFTPFNKYAMRLARPDYVDEIGFIQRTIGTDAEGAEFNVLDEMWNARVTSHIPLSEVAGALSTDRVFERIMLTDKTMQTAGKARPRIAVAALNPHAGDGGNFGHEEVSLIAPAVERAQAHQVNVTGPLPSDTVYLRAHRGEFDVVLSMYHDQGQIAMKLIGFDRGVTLIGGYPFWIATPAHGTAYDIADQGIANPQATKNALLLAARLAASSDRSPASREDTQSAVASILAERTAPAAQDGDGPNRF